ncbi:benzoate 1,2-dioxygenase electron transfer component BenC [Pseudomonas nicosulfuronedens]|uniref:2Fe-2S iron-sulfur cluster binding domain-containing protein n=1 Tax=Pseudomonas nicosulfuronedens TaxID=2571105 RepID=A0A5R9QLH3_9PSED|nr:benzoate 1,2-dioxygenase electron transfer component BenC [Pseudomonas nicosulfuronedens]MDH1011390.1 benzoate 1,2-dioxygenase electron transfer component BenC [Pseudomonas nicosulfuronedens]MDH1982165.1 benzoate 1,2-dioxygenase electron transfer component BenC [Pseudomonas nicosulfuronedens]MDH2030754.1 benzoate 1,2-dioxygenase electron transfer component BenC [Pseudomonas nicosulfuronedens]TLX70345.1 2Fe-2S iron-sulfur cluster binding domain-containing protein [Pseudomonas nicosulfuroneden
MNHKIALNFEDGVTRFIDASPSETVADAAYRQGINIPLDCRDGACGTCKCFAEAGRYDLGQEYIEDALTEDEAEQGYVLTCQMRAQSDCVVRVPASSQVCKTAQASFQASISAVRQLSESTIALSIKGESLSQLAFLPGQYVNLQVPGSEQSRAYSFSSLQKGGEVSFLIRNVPGGLMSSFLTGLAKDGDAMTLAGPLGSFYLREIRRPLLLLAGGTGLAPFTAMLEQIAERGSEHPLHLIYGVTHDFDLVEMDRLEAFAARIPNFTFSACVASPESSYPHKGYVTQHIEPAHLNDGEVDLYLCGPPPMVEAVSAYIREQGITPANFYYEKFAASAA